MAIGYSGRCVGGRGRASRLVAHTTSKWRDSLVYQPKSVRGRHASRSDPVRELLLAGVACKLVWVGGGRPSGQRHETSVWREIPAAAACWPVLEEAIVCSCVGMRNAPGRRD